MLAVERRAP